MNLKETIQRIKRSKKYKALFNDITPVEFLLICIPFIISFATTKGVSRSYFYFVFFAIIIMFSFGVLFLIGIRWRILYFVVLLSISVLIIFIIGKPFEYWMLSDRDEEIRNCIQAILNGENPYKTTTQLGSKPSNLPFSYFLYLPVYIITGGYTFFMYLIVMVIFCVVIFYHFIDTKNNYLILPVISFITFSDFFWLETAMNSDLITIQLILCIFLFLVPDEVPEQKIFLRVISLVPVKPRKINKKIIIFAFLFGSLLASRMHFWLIGGIVGLYLFKIYGLKNTLFLGLIIIGAFLAWVLPFMLMDINHFFNVAPIAHNCKMTIWVNMKFPGSIVSDFLNKFLNYGELNCIIISVLIVIVSLLLGLIKCENKFHLLVIITSCYLIFLFFYSFGLYLAIIRDYVSLVGISFIFAFLYADLEKKKELNKLIS